MDYFSKTTNQFRFSILKTCFLFSVFLASNSLPAQWSDTLNKILHGTMYPTASLDGRNSFVSSERASIWGIKAGVEYSDCLQFGVGYNQHIHNLEKEIYFSDASGIHDSAAGTLHLSYVSIYTRYVYYRTEHWKFSIMPIQLGFGNSRYKYNQQGIDKTINQKAVVIYEPGISISYRFFFWLGVGADLGYRIMLRDNPAIPENFNSMIYSFYVIIYWGDLYKKAFPKSKLDKYL